jgi:hypothetical protein
VWAIDEEHAPLYWFPRDCPRVTVWSRGPGEVAEFQTQFTTTALRVHAIESGWLGRMRETTIYRYVFAADHFVPWEDASGQWISDSDVVPVSVAPLGDLLMAHADASIELRAVPRCGRFTTGVAMRLRLQHGSNAQRLPRSPS